MANKATIEAANQAFASDFQLGDLPMPPARHVAVVTCMVIARL